MNKRGHKYGIQNRIPALAIILLISTVLIPVCAQSDTDQNTFSTQSSQGMRMSGPPVLYLSSDLNISPPDTIQKLVFIHHSTGGYWLADNWGGLGADLGNNSYFGSATNYGWGPNSIGDRTDIGNWWEWFRGPDNETYLSALYNESDQNIGSFGDYTRSLSDPGGENSIVMFKSCFPNSALKGSPQIPIPQIESNPLRGQDSGSSYHTISNAKGIYLDLLNYFITRPDKLFIIITAPPLSDRTYSSNARAFNNWLFNDYLTGYSGNNVFVFDYYNVLTSNGGDPNINDLNMSTGNHHRYWNGVIQHATSYASNTLMYPSDDDHPSSAGQHKAAGEFIPLLNIAYHLWKDGDSPTRIFSFSPTTAPNTGPAYLTIEGQGFKSGSLISLNNGTISIFGTNVVITNSKITCNMLIAGTPCRIYNLTIQNSDGSSCTFPDAFLITNATPTIASITPNTGYNSTEVAVSILGSNFRTGVTISLKNGTDIISGNVINRTISRILGSFPLTNVRSGHYNLTVMNSDGISVTKNHTFTIKSAGDYPTINNITPMIGLNTGLQTVLINGSNFRAGMKVILTNNTISKTAPATLINGGQLKSQLPLTGMQIGQYNLTVKNIDDTTDTWENGFRIINPTPIISTISPSSGYNTTDFQITITGQRFVNGIRATLDNGTTVISGTVSSFNTMKITAKFPLGGVNPGIYNITLTNPGDQNTTKKNCYTVQIPGDVPSITNLLPTSGVNTALASVKVNGTNFRVGATVTISNGTTQKSGSVLSVTGTQMQITLPLAGLPIGIYNLTVQNKDGTNATLQNGFTVTNPTPAISSISPVFGYNTTPLKTSVAGARFVSGAEVFLVNDSTRIQGAISSFTPSLFSATFDLSGVPIGIYNLTVINPGGFNCSKLRCFTIRPAGTTPMITSFSPETGYNTGNIPITINGSDFRVGSSISIRNGTTNKTGMITSFSVSRLKGTISLIGMPYGQYNLSVRNSDGSNTTADTCFTVLNPVPTVTAISPIQGYNSSITKVTIGGTRFASGTVILLINGSNVVTGQVTTLSPTSITGIFPLIGAQPGIYNLTVTNFENLTGVKMNAFTILPPGSAPVISMINPASGFNNANLPVSITGSNFRTAKVFLNQGELLRLATPTVGRISTNSNLYVTLPLIGVPGGTFNITVSNIDGLNTTANERFYVTDQAWITSPKTIVPKPVVQSFNLPNTGNPIRSQLNLEPLGRRAI